MVQDVASELRSLIRLQALDAERYLLRTERDGTPVLIQAGRAALATAAAECEDVAAQLAARKKAVSASERAFEDVERRLLRARQRMPNLISSTQIEATQREIATLGAEKGRLEEEILVGMGAAEELEESVAGQRRSLEAREAEIEALALTWSAREPVVQERLAWIEATRAPIEAGLRQDVLRRYNLGWAQRRKPPAGITTVEGFICTSCGGRVSPLWVQESRICREVHACESCKRIIVFDPDAAPPASQG